MKTTASDLPGTPRTSSVLVALGCVFAFLYLRAAGLNPGIFADEWYYSKMSRLMPLSEAMVPSYLYLWLFRATNACGDGFLDCARAGNALLYVAAAPLIYLVARRHAGPRLAWALALLSLLAAPSLYASFFMPESTYFLGFWALTWVALTRTGWGWPRHALATGALLGLMSLVKVHALFLLPALCLFLLYVAWAVRRDGRWLVTGLASAALAVLAMGAVKFGLGYAIGGEPALTLLGSFYGAGGDISAHHKLLNLLSPALVNGGGHLMALAVLLALPLAVLLHALLARSGRAQPAAPAPLLHVYTILMLGAALGMTVLYTASIAGYGPEEVLRLHLRYYSFTFPLLLIIGAAPVQEAPRPRPLAWMLALLLAGLLVAAMFKLQGYSLRMTDGPEIAPFDMAKPAGHVIAAVELLALLLWAAGKPAARTLFLYVAVPLVLVAGTYGGQRYLRQLKTSWEPEKAGKFAHRYIPSAERKDVTIAATGADLFRAQFHLDSAEAGLLELSKDAPIAHYQMPTRAKWLLVVGQHALPRGVEPEVATPDFKLVRLAPPGKLIGAAEFGQAFPTGLVEAADGLSHSEGWGRWSEGSQVHIRFRDPLPHRFTLTLTASAFGPNTALPFTLHAGDTRAEFRLAQAPMQVTLPLSTSGTERTLVIDVPEPRSPSELYGAGDTRKLGIAISKIELNEISQPSARVHTTGGTCVRVQTAAGVPCR